LIAPVLSLQPILGNQATLRLLAQQAALAAPMLPGSMQAKLAVGRVDDSLEYEADRVAERVMRMPEPGFAVTSGSLQISRKCAKCEDEERADKLQTKRATTLQAPAVAPSLVHQVLRSPGQPLDSGLRAFMEPRFGRDFGGVRVHSDREAAESARAVNALAYTAGQHAVFGTGAYQPDSSSGRQLIAHELAHVIQQSGGQAAVLARQQGNEEDSSMGVPTDAGLPGGVSTPPSPDNSSQQPAAAPQPGPSGNACLDDCERKFKECLNPPWWQFWKVPDPNQCLAERQACQRECGSGGSGQGETCRNVGSGGCSYNEKTKKGTKRCSYGCDNGTACSDMSLSCGPGNWDPPCPANSSQPC
jgi:hypothetical protein